MSTYRADPQGRYALNDVHAAAQGHPSKSPSEFAYNFGPFLDALKDPEALAHHDGELWGNDVVILRYAAWIDPEVEVQFFRALHQAIVNAGTDSTPEQLSA